MGLTYLKFLALFSPGVAQLICSPNLWRLNKSLYIYIWDDLHGCITLIGVKYVPIPIHLGKQGHERPWSCKGGISHLIEYRKGNNHLPFSIHSQWGPQLMRMIRWTRKAFQGCTRLYQLYKTIVIQKIHEACFVRCWKCRAPTCSAIYTASCPLIDNEYLLIITGWCSWMPSFQILFFLVFTVREKGKKKGKERKEQKDKKGKV